MTPLALVFFKKERVTSRGAKTQEGVLDRKEGEKKIEIGKSSSKQETIVLKKRKREEADRHRYRRKSQKGRSWEEIKKGRCLPKARNYDA